MKHKEMTNCPSKRVNDWSCRLEVKIWETASGGKDSIVKDGKDSSPAAT